MLLIEILLIIAGFFILIKSGDYLVDHSILIARRLGMSELVIGFTIVAFGTSAPELMINIQSAINGIDDFVFGNIFGSNSINILVALGITGLLAPMKIKTQTIKIEAPFLAAITLLLTVLLLDTVFGEDVNILSMQDGVILLVCFLIFILYNIKISKSTEGGEADDEEEIDSSLFKSITVFLFACVGLYFGGNMIVDNATLVGDVLEVPKSIMGLTVLALGTSLPEIVVSIRSAQRGKADIAIGGMIGSNIFNILLVLSISAMFHPPVLKDELFLDLAIVNISAFMLLFFIMLTKDNTIYKRGATLFLVTYIVYVLVRLS
jgi:cation:H+ antiporter